MSPGLLALYAVVRGLIYLGLLLLVGAQVVRWLIRPLDNDYAFRDSPLRRLERVPRAALVGLLMAVAARGALQVESFLDPGDHITAELTRAVLLTGSWGHAWLLQTAAVIATLVLVSVVGRRALGGFIIPLLAVILWGQTGMGTPQAIPGPGSTDGLSTSRTLPGRESGSARSRYS